MSMIGGDGKRIGCLGVKLLSGVARLYGSLPHLVAGYSMAHGHIAFESTVFLGGGWSSELVR